MRFFFLEKIWHVPIHTWYISKTIELNRITSLRIRIDSNHEMPKACPNSNIIKCFEFKSLNEKTRFRFIHLQRIEAYYDLLLIKLTIFYFYFILFIIKYCVSLEPLLLISSWYFVLFKRLLVNFVCQLSLDFSCWVNRALKLFNLSLSALSHCIKNGYLTLAFFKVNQCPTYFLVNKCPYSVHYYLARSKYFNLQIKIWISQSVVTISFLF